MSKTTAHIFLWLLDVASLFGAWVAYQSLTSISAGIESRQPLIEIQWPVGGFFLLLILPVIHLTSVFSDSTVKKLQMNRLLLGLFAAVIGWLVFLNVSTSQRLKSADYRLDESQSSKGTYSWFCTYQLENMIESDDGQRKNRSR